MTDETIHRHHDMGGEPAGPVDRTEHMDALWEKRVDAMVMALVYHKPPIMTVDQLRRGIEDLPPDAYDKLSYYERWITSVSKIVVEAGCFTRAELDAKLAEVKARKETPK